MANTVTIRPLITTLEHVTCMGEMRNSYKITDGKPDRKRPSEDIDVDEDNIKIYLH
jgi:hypothetical protein